MMNIVAPPAGAWIETIIARDRNTPDPVAPPAGAWIETTTPYMITFKVNLL